MRRALGRVDMRLGSGMRMGAGSAIGGKGIWRRVGAQGQS